LSEWFRTMGDLPVILRQAVQMGLFSSQQLVRFCRMDNRPGVARTVARSLPTSVRTWPAIRVSSSSCGDYNMPRLTLAAAHALRFLYSPCSCSCRHLRVQYNLQIVAETLAETVLLVSQFSRGLVGRMMADPAFLQKLAMEQAITISSSLWWEAQQRGDRFSKVRGLLLHSLTCLCPLPLSCA